MAQLAGKEISVRERLTMDVITWLKISKQYKYLIGLAKHYLKSKKLISFFPFYCKTIPLCKLNIQH